MKRNINRKLTDWEITNARAVEDLVIASVVESVHDFPVKRSACHMVGQVSGSFSQLSKRACRNEGQARGYFWENIFR